MTGHNVFFPLCFDVNGTPIEVKVEKKHHITKLDTPRQEYRRLCEEYANGFIEEMTHHFEILGESMDPSIYYQTDAPYYRRVTQLSFVELFRRGLVYKANYPVNWCPRKSNVRLRQPPHRIRLLSHAQTQAPAVVRDQRSR